MADKITTKVKLKMDMGKVSKFLEDYAEAGMENAMDKAEGIIKDSYQPGSGRIYIKHGKQHRASAPGEPPAVDS